MPKIPDLQKRLYLASIVILILGLAGALLIYATAEDDPDTAFEQEMAHSKPYVRELQRFGGKAAVLFDEFNRWFTGLWQGKALAITVAWISIIASLGVFLVASRLSCGSEDEHD